MDVEEDVIDDVFVIATPTFEYNLPSLSERNAKVSGAGLGVLYKFRAMCRVQTSDGTIWIVDGTNQLWLGYVLASDTIPEAVYFARSRAGNAAFKSCLHRNMELQNLGQGGPQVLEDCHKSSKAAADKVEGKINGK